MGGEHWPPTAQKKAQPDTETEQGRRVGGERGRKEEYHRTASTIQAVACRWLVNRQLAAHAHRG